MKVIACSALLVCLISLGSACDTRKIGRCLLKLPQAVGPKAFLPSNMLNQCKALDNLKVCLVPHTDGCTDQQLKSMNMALNFLDFYCTPRMMKELSYARDTCMGGERAYNYKTMVSTCEAMRLAASCRKARQITKCVRAYLTNTCSRRVAAVYIKLFVHLVNMNSHATDTPRCFNNTTEDKGLGDKAHGAVENKILRVDSGSGSTHAYNIADLHHYDLFDDPKYYPSVHQPRKKIRNDLANAYHIGHIIGYVLGAFIVTGIAVTIVVLMIRRQHQRTRGALVYHDVLARI